MNLAAAGELLHGELGGRGPVLDPAPELGEEGAGLTAAAEGAVCHARYPVVAVKVLVVLVVLPLHALRVGVRTTDRDGAVSLQKSALPEKRERMSSGSLLLLILIT